MTFRKASKRDLKPESPIEIFQIEAVSEKKLENCQDTFDLFKKVGIHWQLFIKPTKRPRGR